MNKAILVLVLMGVSFFNNPALAEDTAGQAMPQASVELKSPEPVTINNKVCPVMGETIDETSKTLYEYEGKVYSFCCPACVEQFKANPKKYIDAMNTQANNTSGE